MKGVISLLFGAALLTAIVMLPLRLLPFLGPVLPIVGSWGDPDDQYRRVLGDVPYDLLRTAEAQLPRDISVLLVTSGKDVRRTEYITFHRAMYFLAPRPVWWQSPAPPDGTWESRWWISAPLTPASVQAVAAEKDANCVLTYGIQPAPALGRVVATWGEGYLLQLDDSVPCLSGITEAPARSAATGWPLRLLAALMAIAAFGDLLLVTSGHRAYGAERALLSWSIGAGVLTVAMFWLNAAGPGLAGQQIVIAALAGSWLLVRLLAFWRHRRPTTGPARRSAFDDRVRQLPRPRWHTVALWSLWLLILIGIAGVAVVAVGRPLQIWDSWVNWGSKARVMFLDGGLTSAVYAEPSRAVALLDYPLFLPLLEAWIYRWLGAPDDRLVGIVSVLFYLALVASCYTAVRQRGGSPLLAWSSSAVVATMANVIVPAAAVFADIPLAVFATVAAVSLVRWLEDGPPAVLVIGACAAGTLPWIKREGLVLLAALCMATLLAGRGHVFKWPARRAWHGASACALAGLVLAGPWWMFASRHAIGNDAFLPVSAATFFAHLDRLPVIAALQLRNLAGPGWNFVWPLALILALLLRFTPSTSGGTDRSQRLVALLPLTAFVYLAVTSLAYVFSNFVPYQQHVMSSVHRLALHVVALVVIWMAVRGSTAAEETPA